MKNRSPLKPPRNLSESNRTQFSDRSKKAHSILHTYTHLNKNRVQETCRCTSSSSLASHRKSINRAARRRRRRQPGSLLHPRSASRHYSSALLHLYTVIATPRALNYRLTVRGGKLKKKNLGVLKQRDRGWTVGAALRVLQPGAGAKRHPGDQLGAARALALLSSRDVYP